MLIYTLFIFLLCFSFLLYVRQIRIDGVNNWIIPAAFSIKVLVGFCFLYIYTEVYGQGKLGGDAGNFMNESKLLHAVFIQSPIDYFKLLFGIDNSDLAIRYLGETRLWGAGKQTIINDSRNIIKIHSVIHFFSFGINGIHMILMCFLSTIGLVQLIKGIKDLTNLKPLYTFLIFLLFPSLLFWTSGILKEPIMLLGLGLFIRGFFYKGTLMRKGLFLIFGGIILLGFKPYILLCLIPSIAFYQVYKSLPKFKIIGSAIVLSISLFILLVAFSSQRDFAVKLLSKKQYDFKNIGKGGVFLNYGINFLYLQPEQFNELMISDSEKSELMEVTPEIIQLNNLGKFVLLKDTLKATVINHGGFGEPRDTILGPNLNRYKVSYINYGSQGLIDVTMINNSGVQLVKNIPEVIVNCLFRPFPLDPGGLLKYPSILEVWLTFGFLIFAIIHRHKLSEKDKALIISILIFVLSLSLLIGWVTPVIGAIVRYRFPALLGVLIISLIIWKVPARFHK